MTTNLKSAVIFGIGLAIGIAIGDKVIMKARALWSTGR